MQGINVKRRSLGRFETELNGLLFAFGSADAAAHTFLKVHACQTIHRINSIKLAEPGAHATADAEIGHDEGLVQHHHLAEHVLGFLVPGLDRLRGDRTDLLADHARDLVRPRQASGRVDEGGAEPDRPLCRVLALAELLGDLVTGILLLTVFLKGGLPLGLLEVLLSTALTLEDLLHDFFLLGLNGLIVKCSAQRHH